MTSLDPMNEAAAQEAKTGLATITGAPLALSDPPYQNPTRADHGSQSQVRSSPLVLEQLDHLPVGNRREIARVMQIIFEEFDAIQKGKLSGKRHPGRILKLILYGSYSRGDWVEDKNSGYKSDYDLLAVVNTPAFADDHDIWRRIDERLLKEFSITGHLETSAKVIAHSLMDVNDRLARGLPFFMDIARDGIMLYEEPGHPLAEPKPLTPEAAKAEARRHFEQWFPLSVDALEISQLAVERRKWRDGAFMLHQATERAYHCTLLTLTLYSPKLHRLTELRRQAERASPKLIEAWPRDTKFARRSFTRLDRAYVDARYSAHYEITTEEIDWLVKRIIILQNLVKQVCEAQLNA
jgi:predicted nucleotidyltransferase/HEPN domain-containing protein